MTLMAFDDLACDMCRGISDGVNARALSAGDAEGLMQFVLLLSLLGQSNMPAPATLKVARNAVARLSHELAECVSLQACSKPARWCSDTSTSLRLLKSVSRIAECEIVASRIGFQIEVDSSMESVTVGPAVCACDQACRDTFPVLNGCELAEYLRDCERLDLRCAE